MQHTLRFLTSSILSSSVLATCAAFAADARPNVVYIMADELGDYEPGFNGGADYFSSADHPRGVHSANKNSQTGVEYRGHKGQLYEGGLRVPFLARWPGKIAAGGVSEYLGYFPDVLPTIAEVTGAQAPADVDGFSILPTLIGEKAAGHTQKQHDFLRTLRCVFIFR